MYDSAIFKEFILLILKTYFLGVLMGAKHGGSYT